MMGSYKTKMLLGAVALLTVSVAGLPAAMTVSAQSAQAGGTIKLGAFAPLSGSSAASGTDIINAVKLAAATVNKSGGVLGQKVAVDAQDSPCNPQVAVQAAQKLVTDNAVAVVGPYCSSDAFPASTIFHRAGIAMITPAATNPRLTQQGFDDIFRTCGNDAQQGAFAADIMVHKFHATRIALIHDNTTYAKGLAQLTRDAAEKYHAKIVFFDAITPGSHDFSSTLTKLRTLNPQATYFTGYYADGGLLLKQFVQLGVPGKFMAGDANNDPTFIKLAGSAASKAYVTTAPIPQMVPSASSFVKQYAATYHTAPGPFSGYAYDAAQAVFQAIKIAKSTAPDAIVKALPKVKMANGVTGRVSFKSNGDRAEVQYTLVKASGDHFVQAHL